MQVTVTAFPTSLPKDAVIILPYFEGGIKTNPPKHIKHLAVSLKHVPTAGEKSEVATVSHGSHTYYLIGVGSKDCFEPFDVRSIGKTMNDLQEDTRPVFIDPTLIISTKTEEAIVKECAFAASLADYEFNKYKSKHKSRKPKKVRILLDKPTANLKKAVKDIMFTVDGITVTRDLVNEPSNIATPKYMATFLKKQGKALGWKVEVFNHKKILSMGMNLVDAVGRGSKDEPHFVKVTYTGNPSSKQHMALVGKGVCFDTGGVQNKSGFNMNTMKGDMGGAATVVGILTALSKHKAKVNIKAYLPFVKNSIDGASYNPDDVYVAYNKKTVEIRHTDAEGRLILADALAYASTEKPERIYDFATLTGASIVALGPEFAAIIGTDFDNMTKLIDHGFNIDDKVWQLPIHNNYQEFLRSDVADIANTPKTRSQPGTITAGMFLQHFVKEDIPWIHFDIAAVATLDEPHSIYSTFGTGKIVRLVTEHLQT